MSIFDLSTYILGVPQYRFDLNKYLYSCILGCGIKPERQILGSSSDVRVARNVILSEFMWNPHIMGKSNVLLFCDQDTVPEPSDFEALVATCSESVPIIGSNMVYRHDAKAVNWFLKDDPTGAKRAIILKDSSFVNKTIQVDYIGFGLVAIHRKAIEKMINHYGTTLLGGNKKIPFLFSEMRERLLNNCGIPDEMAVESFRTKFVNSGEMSDESFEKVKNAILFHWKHGFPDRILPETFSFCERARAIGIPIHVNLGVRPGHLTEQVLCAEYPSAIPIEQDFPPLFYENDMIYSSKIYF